MSLGSSTIMIDLNKKHTILEEILKSNSFINSKLNSKLLTYLVECEITNKSPSEYSIALDVFKKDSSFNPNEDTLVRVSVYNLRKKLERYYQNMGKRTKLRVKIPKGQYEVKFFNYHKDNFRDKIKNPYLVLLPIITVLIGFILYLLLINPRVDKLNYRTSTKNFAKFLYSDFTNSSNPKLISLGDDFIYYSDFSEFNTTSIRRMYRNSNINNEEEFEKFKSVDPGKDNLKKLPFSFFNQAAVWPLPHLTKLLYDFDAEYSIRKNSTLNSNDLNTHDIFFIGSFWTLGILKKVINDLGINYCIIGEEQLTIQDNTHIDSVITYNRTGIPAFDHIDYATFIKIPGPNNNTIYLLVSFYATGSVGAIKYLTSENTVNVLKEKFESKLDDIPPYYLIIFKSTGNNREVLSTELIKLQQINPEIITW